MTILGSLNIKFYLLCYFNGFNGTRGGGRLPGIRVKEGEPFERALRRFTKTCEKAGIMSEIRKHQHFEKPSAKRKRKINAAKRKNMKRMQANGY